VIFWDLGMGCDLGGCGAGGVRLSGLWFGGCFAGGGDWCSVVAK